MSMQPVTHQPRHPAGSPAGGQFTPRIADELDVELATREWQPSELDMADLGITPPRIEDGEGHPDPDQPDEVDEQFYSSTALDEAAMVGEDRWLRRLYRD